jgi:Protein of unknown function (DUF1559)
MMCRGQMAWLLAAAIATSAGCEKKKESSGGGGSSEPSTQNSSSRKPIWATDADFAGLRAKDKNNLRVIGMTMHSYADAKGGALAPAAICDAKGKPLLSWRVAILPYADETALYNEFKLDEPWDSEHNKKLIPKMPVTYLLPGSGSEKDGYTHYRVFVAPMFAPSPRPIFAIPNPNAPGPLRNPFLIGNMPDGTSNTIMVAEAEEAVIWTKPDELVYAAKGPLPKLGYFWKDSSNVLMGDGAVRGVSIKVSEQTLRNAITADDLQVLGEDW